MSPKTSNILPKGERRHRAKVQQTLSRHCAAAADFVLYTRATIASATAGRRSPPPHRCRTRAAACRLVPRRKLRSAAPKAALLALSFTWLRHFSRQPEFELKRGIDIYPDFYCVKKLCVILFKSLGNCRSQVITTTLETSPKKLTIEYKSSKNGFGTDFGLDHFGTFDCQQSR